MTIKELQIIIDSARKEANEFYDKGLCYQWELYKVREKVYELNKDAGFYGVAGMEYKEFLETMRSYSYEDQMKVAYAFLQHIALLDNIVFDEEGEV